MGESGRVRRVGTGSEHLAGGALPERAPPHGALPPGVMRQARPHDGLPPGSVRHPDTPHPDHLPGRRCGTVRQALGVGAHTAAPGPRIRRQQPGTRTTQTPLTLARPNRAQPATAAVEAAHHPRPASPHTRDPAPTGALKINADEFGSHRPSRP